MHLFLRVDNNWEWKFARDLIKKKNIYEEQNSEWKIWIEKGASLRDQIVNKNLWGIKLKKKHLWETKLKMKICERTNGENRYLWGTKIRF